MTTPAPRLVQPWRMMRRELVRAGALGLFGLSFADVLRGWASTQAATARSFGRAKRCILLFM